MHNPPFLDWWTATAKCNPFARRSKTRKGSIWSYKYDFQTGHLGTEWLEKCRPHAKVWHFHTRFQIFWLFHEIKLTDFVANVRQTKLLKKTATKYIAPFSRLCHWESPMDLTKTSFHSIKYTTGHLADRSLHPSKLNQFSGLSASTDLDITQHNGFQNGFLLQNIENLALAQRQNSSVWRLKSSTMVIEAMN